MGTSSFLKNKEIIYVDIDKTLCKRFSEYKQVFSINLDLKIFLNLLIDYFQRKFFRNGSKNSKLEKNLARTQK